MTKHSMEALLKAQMEKILVTVSLAHASDVCTN